MRNFGGCSSTSARKSCSIPLSAGVRGGISPSKCGVVGRRRVRKNQGRWSVMIALSLHRRDVTRLTADRGAGRHGRLLTWMVVAPAGIELLEALPDQFFGHALNDI